MTACKFGDPYCPCQDGDACHYVNYPGSPAMRPSITNTRRSALAALGWSQRRFAARIGYDESTVRHWFRTDDVPAWLDPWLQRRARALEADPPPAQPVRKPGRPVQARRSTT